MTPPSQHLQGYLASTEQRMRSLQCMHEIATTNPGAEGKFFFLMGELSYRYILGVERLHIKRTRLAQPLRQVQDDVVWWCGLRWHLKTSAVDRAAMMVLS